ncbi:AAA family ATPase [Rickettsiales bacterium]|nr:AAA family ATPase [Rickettsiales bacterium]
MDKKTSDRFKNFDSFIRSDIEEKVGNLELKLKNNLNTINSLNFLNDQKFKSLLDDIKTIDKDKYKKLISYIASLRLKKIVFCNKLKRNDFIFVEIVTHTSNLDVLESQKVEISKYIDELLEIQKNNDLSPLRKEQNEIADKLTLKKLTSAIDLEIDRLIKMDKLKKCVSAANTRTITQLGNTIANDIITPKLRDAFLKEIIDFIGNRFRVEFEHVGGKYGSPQYKINLIANPKLDVSLILSEGEQTCVAIAAFLAELSTSSHSSPLVFDDPITSLDHKWRDKVAKRLVLEAKNRQVIIFTHDLVFFNDIKEYCEEESVDFSAKQVQRYGEVSGRVDISHPWDGMKVKERIDALEKMARELQKERNNYSEEDYKMRARDFYSKLRASWERGLEQVGLCNVVIRHRDYINSKNLEKISILNLDDCKSWNKNFKKCCNFTNAHDGGSARNQSLPEPQELSQDVSELLSWVNDIRERQNPKQQSS